MPNRPVPCSPFPLLVAETASATLNAGLDSCFVVLHEFDMCPVDTSHAEAVHTKLIESLLIDLMMLSAVRAGRVLHHISPGLVAAKKKSHILGVLGILAGFSPAPFSQS